MGLQSSRRLSLPYRVAWTRASVRTCIGQPQAVTSKRNPVSQADCMYTFYGSVKAVLRHHSRLVRAVSVLRIGRGGRAGETEIVRCAVSVLK